MPEDIIKKVRKGITHRDEVIRSLYTDASIRKAVIGTLIKLGCQEKEAKDRFTDAIVSFIKSCYKPEFSISSSLTNYLIGTAKNIWLKGVTKSQRERTTVDQSTMKSDSTAEDHLISEERRVLLQQLLDQLDSTCKKVLTLWSINKKMKAIAKDLKYKSEGMARKKKHQCLQRLCIIVEQHPHIKQDLRHMI